MFVILFTLNTIAIFYGVTAALPFGTLVVILFVLTLVSFPLLAFGGAIGYHFRTKFQAPSATKRLPREIPPSAWYRKTPGQMFIGGLLPFSAIVLELHNFYASLWGYKIFTHSSVLLATFIILVILVAMLSVGLTYIQLTVEDHEWWWRYVLRLSTYNKHIYTCMFCSFQMLIITFCSSCCFCGSLIFEILTRFNYL